VANHWILKTDADTYAFDHLVRERRAVRCGTQRAPVWRLASRAMRAAATAKRTPSMPMSAAAPTAAATGPASRLPAR